MSAQYKNTPVKGKIVPLASTRMRIASSTFTKVLNTYQKGTSVEIDLVREYTTTDMSEYHMAGDKWGRVIKVNGEAPKDSNGQPVTGEAWMAIVYLGTPVCSESYSIVDQPAGDAPKIVGMVATLKYEDGTQSEPVNLVVTDEQIT